MGSSCWFESSHTTKSTIIGGPSPRDTYKKALSLSVHNCLTHSAKKNNEEWLQVLFDCLDKRAKFAKGTIEIC